MRQQDGYRARRTDGAWALGLVLVALLSAGAAQAVPSFARQTGMACEACHTVWPELTHFGRTFKANGYVLDNLKQVRDISPQKAELLDLASTPPLSIMLQAGYTQLAKSVPDNSTGVPSGASQNGTIDFPQQVGIFYAGKIAPHLGAFLQLTYDNGSGTIGIDNTDVRLANLMVLPDDQSLIYGVSLNNNPTVQDLWNSAPAWSEPFISSPAMQTPVAGAQILGAMAGVTAGLSTYVFVDQSFYAEIGGYRSALQGQSVASQGDTTNNIISGVAPYWRLAYEYDWGNQSLEVGTSGIYAELRNPTTPGGNAINNSLQHALTDNFTDYGIDGQYQYISDDNQLTVTTAWVHEHEGLNASFAEGFSANTSNNLDNYNVVASYYWQRKFGASLGFYGVNGSTDPLYFGTNSGNSNSDWGVAEIDYVPWLNVKLGLQYTLYTKFDGGTTNYDGLGRNASDNNMLFAYLWVSF